jgi:hypothetical protein
MERPAPVLVKFHVDDQELDPTRREGTRGGGDAKKGTLQGSSHNWPHVRTHPVRQNIPTPNCFLAELSTELGVI